MILYCKFSLPHLYISLAKMENVLLQFGNKRVGCPYCHISFGILPVLKYFILRPCSTQSYFLSLPWLVHILFLVLHFQMMQLSNAQALIFCPVPLCWEQKNNKYLHENYDQEGCSWLLWSGLTIKSTTSSVDSPSMLLWFIWRILSPTFTDPAE